MAKRISAEDAAKAMKLELPDSEYAVTARSILGVDVALPAESHKDAHTRARELRVLENHMVCILEKGSRVVRWDRINAAGGYVYGEYTPLPKDQNRWRRVAVDRGEFIGGIRDIWTRFVYEPKIQVVAQHCFGGPYVPGLVTAIKVAAPRRARVPVTGKHTRAEPQRRYTIYRGGVTPTHKILATHDFYKVVEVLWNAQTLNDAETSEARHYLKLPSQEILAQGDANYREWLTENVGF